MKSLIRNRKPVVFVLVSLLLVLGTFLPGYADITPVSERTPQVRDAIVAAVSGVNNAADVTAAHLSRIEVLSLSEKNITALKIGDFDGLSAVNTIFLSRNSLTSLPVGLFSGLSSLEYLYLDGNRLTSLPEDIFNGLSSLIGLSLGSSLTSLPKDIFSGLSSLIWLSLRYTDLTSLSKDNFNGLSSLTFLGLEFNMQLTNLPEDVFSGLSSLTSLSLYGNNLTSLPEDIFSGLSSLTSLNLFDSRELTNLPAGIFKGLSSLTELKLFCDKLTSLPDGIFSDLSSLTRLTLGCPLTSLSVGIFKGLSSLTYLDLFWISLDLYPAGIFSELSSLTTLVILESTLILPPGEVRGSLPTGVFRGLSSLTSLDLGEPESYGVVSLSVSLEKVGVNQFKAVVPTGAPFDIVLPIQVNNANINGGATTLTIPVGSMESGLLTVTRIRSTTADITVDIRTLPALPTTTDSDGNRLHRGYMLVKSADLPLHFPLPRVNSLIGNRTPQVRDAIVAAVPGVNNAADVTAAHLAAITALDLSSQDIPALKSGDFDGLTALTNLNLYDNDLTSLPEDVFNGLSSLTTLSLRKNRLIALPSDIFDGLTALTDLDLSNLNNLVFGEFKSLPVDIFDGLTALTNLNLQGNDFTTLPAGIFDGLTSLEKLYLTSNDLTTLPGGIFDELTSVKTIWLDNNKLSSLPADTFDGLTSITVLFLNNNSLTSLPVGIFDDLTTLQTIFLNDNSLTSLPDDVFDDLTSLSQLRLSNNKLTSLTSGIFENLTELNELWLNNNVLSSLPNNVFKGLSHLRRLSLGGNSVDPIPIIVSLEKVADGQFKAVAPTGAPFNVVLPLTVTNGSISGGATTVRIPTGSVESKTLTVTHTSVVSNITSVNIGALPGIPTYYNQGYILVKPADLPLTFTGLSSILPLNQRTPQVRDAIVRAAGVQSAADVTEAHLSKILQLDLEQKSITSLKVGDFDGLTSLTGLFLRHNELTTLPADIFDGLTSLTTLNLEYNELSTLPAGIFEDLTDLHYLTLSNNKLTTLPTGIFEGPSALWDIWLDGNRFTSLPVGIFKSQSVATGFLSLRKLYLEDNTVDPLPLTISLEKVGDEQFKAVVPAGAPFNIVLPITVTNGSITGGATRITIPVGSVESQPLTVKRTVGRTGAVTINIGTLPSLPSDHNGYVLVKSTDLPLTISLNSAPVFANGTSTTRSVAENTTANRNIGMAIAATDADTGDTLTYTLGGTDAASFSIVSTSGQLQTKASLDYETKTTYSLTITVSDGKGGSDSIAVTINVTDVDETPLVPVSHRSAAVRDAIVASVPNVSNAAHVTKAQLSAITSLNIRNAGITTLQADDFSGMTGLTSLSLFNNQLSSLPDGIFEGLTALTTIRLGGNVVDPLPFIVSLVKVADGQFKAVAPVGALFNIVLPITVTNGSITGGVTTITIPQGSVESGILTLTRNVSTTVNVTVDIGTLPSLPRNHFGYALVRSDSLPLTVISGTNAAPVFTDGTRTTRSVLENTASGQHIGTAVTATDADNDTLAYTLGGTDAASFEIDRTTGQLKTKAALDYETKSTYTVTVSVSDGNGGMDSITVTINVTDVTEPSTPQEPTTPVESGYDHIKGPWLWMIAPGGDLDTDNLSEASEGVITEAQIAENGVNEGDHFNQLQWTSGSLLPTIVCGILLCSSDNVINVVRKIGLTDKTQLTNYSAYALINIHSPIDQDNVLMGVGSDDSIKVWLNGSVVHENDVTRRTRGIQDRFRVNLNAGNNLLLIKVCNSSIWIGNDDWGMFFKIYLDTQDYTISLPMRDTENAAPVFTEGSSTSRAVAENTAAGQHIGTAVGATDSDGNTLVYTLGGTDAASFGIDRTTGQLKTKAALDYETKTTYTVTVTVFDGTLIDTITVTINVTDVAETTEPNPPTSTTNPTLNITTAALLTEDMLHGGFITLNLTDGTFDSSHFRIRNAVSVSGIIGVTVARFGGERISDTQATVELVFDGNMTADGTLTVSVGADAIQDYDGAALTAQISVTAVTESITASTESALTEATLDETEVTITLSGRKFERSVFDIQGAVSVSGITGVTFPVYDPNRESDTEITLELEYSGNMTADGTLTFTIGADAIQDYNGSSLTASISVSAVSESVTVLPASLTEATLDESIVTLTLSGRKFERWNSIIRGAVSVSGISGVTVRSFDIDRQSDTEVTVELTYDGDMTSDSTLIFTVGEDAIASYNGPDLTAQVSVSASADAPVETGDQTPETPETPQQPVNTGGTLVLTVTATQLTEAALHGAVVSLNLSGGTFDSSHFRIRNAVFVSGISGVTVARFGGDRISDTQATVELAFDGNMTSNGTLTVSVGADAIKDYDGAALTSQISVAAVTESITVLPASLTEATLDESIVTLTLSGRKFERWNSIIRGAVSVSGISGVTVRSFDIDRQSDTEVTVELTYDGDMTSDSTLTFTVGEDAIAGYNGPDLTAQITVTINVTEGTIDPPLSERTQQVREAIVAAVPGVTDANNVTAAHLAAITRLSLNRKSITSLKTGDFNGLTSLTYLSLEGNSITDISTLENLTSLTYLNLGSNPGGNSISDISALENLTALTYLDLRNNSVSDISALEGLTALVTLDLRYNSVSDVSALEGLTSLRNLSLRGNAISDYGPLRKLKEANPNITIDVNINNNPPVFSDGDSTTRSIAENTINLGRKLIGSPVTAIDADTDDTLTYAISSGDFVGGGRVFYIDSITGQLYTQKILDYEKQASYTLTVSVSDGNNGLDTITVTVNVMDVPETRYNVGDTILEYDGTSEFNIGLIFTRENQTYVYTCVSDDQCIITNGEVTQGVIDGPASAENSAPVFTEGASTTRSVAENTASGQDIGSAVSATDTDSGDTLTYTLGGTDAASFRIVSTSGQLQTNSALDYETKNSYSVTVSVSDGNGGRDSIAVTINVLDVAEAPAEQSLPPKTLLLTNFPNPFNPETWIPYQLANAAEVTLTIYDMRGVVVRQLQLGHKPAGVYSSRSRAIHWDGRNSIGEKVATGVYFYTLTAGDFTATRKMLIRK